MKKIIDLRSDTFTVPDAGMREAMASAPVGDDVWREDSTVTKLEEMTAEYFGKEAALFVPSGTMGNQLGIRVNTEDGDELITEADAHIYYYETAAPSLISRVQIRPVKSSYGEIDVEELNAHLRGSEYYYPKSALLLLESSHNRHGGYPLSLVYMREASQWAKSKGLRTHLDGARVWNSIRALGVDPKVYVKGIDTISVCFSKGLGAPVGSALVGDRVAIDKALKWRKILGGGMRQAGIIAAGAIYALENNLRKLDTDHEHCKQIADAIQAIPGVSLDPKHALTNILRFETPEIEAEKVVARCADEGLLLMATGRHSYRIVLYHQITSDMVMRAIEILTKAIESENT
jgi:threonine aldolase